MSAFSSTMETSSSCLSRSAARVKLTQIGKHIFYRDAVRSRDSFSVAHRIRVEKVFAFERTGPGSWRCSSAALQPVDHGTALAGP